jgi:hypothetical protein
MYCSRLRRCRQNGLRKDLGLRTALERETYPGTKDGALRIAGTPCCSHFAAGSCSYGDVVFYKLQLERLGFAEQGASENTISESSLRELRSLIERVGFLRPV